MKKTLIFCDSYGQIKYVLQLVLLNYKDHQISIVIPGYEDLFQFFKAINDKVFRNALDIIYIESYRHRSPKATGMSRLLQVLPDIINEKRYLKVEFDNHFSKVQDSEVFFVSRGAGGIEYYLLSGLSKNNRLVYVSHPPPYLIPYTPFDLRGIVNLILSRVVYGCDLGVSKIPTYKGFPYVPDRFLKKNVSRVMEWPEVERMMKGFNLDQFKVFDAGNYSVIFLDDDVLGVAYVPQDGTFEKRLTDIFGIVIKYFPEKEIAFKYHPGHPQGKVLISLGDTLPSFIPAELLYNERVTIYLSVFSRAIANVEKGLAVSIADLITFKSSDIKKKMKDELVQVSKSKILFPQTLDEFEQILMNLKANAKS